MKALSRLYQGSIMALLRQQPREHRCAGTTHSNIPALFASLSPHTHSLTHSHIHHMPALTLRRLLLYTCHSSPQQQQASQWSQQTLLKIQHWRGAIHVSSYCYMCVLTLLYMCPHTAIHVSSYCDMCVLILLHVCPHTAVYVSSYCYICVLILLYVYSQFQWDGAVSVSPLRRCERISFNIS